MSERNARVSEPVGAGVALMEAATPHLYRTNAFRVTALPVDATARDISRQLQRAAMLERLGQAPYAMTGPIALTPPPDSDAVRDAMQRLRDPERRLMEELFWFWPKDFGHSSKDEALLALNQADLEASTKIWAERARKPAEAGVAVHNLAVLAHLLALDYEYAVSLGHTSPTLIEQRDKSWRHALDRWVVFVSHDAYWGRVTERIRTFDDPRLTETTARQIRSALPLAIAVIPALLALHAAERGDGKETVRLVDMLQRSGFAREVVDGALTRALQPVRRRVKLLCESAAEDLAGAPAEGATVARRLLEHALPAVAVLDRLLPAGDATRDGAHDEVALHAESCLAAYAGETEDWKAVQIVHEYARRLAASPSTQERMKRSSEAIKTNVTYGTCWFCKTNPLDEAAAVPVPMHGNVTRTPQGAFGMGGTQVRWQRLTVRVPRCGTCATAHRRTKGRRNAGLVLGSLAGIIGCSALVGQSDENAGQGLVVAVATAGIGALVGWLSGRAQEPATMSSLDTKAQFPAIQNMLKDGWALGDKPSGVE